MSIFSKLFSNRPAPSRSFFSLEEKTFLRVVLDLEKEQISSMIPSLSGQVLLEIAPRLPTLSPLFQGKGASLVSVIGASEGATIRSRWEILPFQDNSCAIVICRAFFIRKDLGRTIKEISRILQPGGTVYLSDQHPFSPVVQQGQRESPVTEEGGPPGFERYSRFFQAGNLNLKGVKELFFDATVKKRLSEKDQGQFDLVRKGPFLVFLSAQKEGS